MLNNIVYTLYKQSTSSLKIGFSNSDLLDKQIEEVPDYLLIEIRYGSNREEKIIKSTLLELGFHPETKEDDYKYSINLIKYLTSSAGQQAS